MEEGKKIKTAGRLEGQKRLGKLIAEHYGGAHEARKEKRHLIAWCNVAAPAEILWTFDFICLFPEAYAATCGARHAATHHCEITEAHGYENHLCTYTRNGIGSVLAEMEHKEPFQPLAHPDLIVGSTSYCIVMQKWIEALGELFKVPVINIDIPFIAPGIEKREVVDYTKGQLLDFISYLERFTGRKFDWDKFNEIVAQGQRTSTGYQKLLDMTKADPAPASYFDLMAHNFPNIVLRYKPEAEEHYKLLNAEIEQRIADGVEAFEGMKHRIYWDGVPFWFGMGSQSQKLMELGMCLITSAYSTVFSYSQLDALRPLESEAELVSLIYLNRNITYKTEYTKRLYREFKLDGGIYAYALCCKPFSITMRPIMDAVTRDLGVPNIIVEGDLVDHRYYSEEAAFARLDTFAEELEARKKT